MSLSILPGPIMLCLWLCEVMSLIKTLNQQRLNSHCHDCGIRPKILYTVGISSLIRPIPAVGFLLLINDLEHS